MAWVICAQGYMESFSLGTCLAWVWLSIYDLGNVRDLGNVCDLDNMCPG